MGNRGPTSITVLIAALNEEEGMRPTMEELKSTLEEASYLVVDGNSVDETAEIAREMGARVVCQEGSGKGSAIAQALGHVDSDTRYVVFIDADFTYPAEYILKMLQILDENPEVGMVVGNRFNRVLKLSSMKSPYFIGNRFLAVTQRFFNGVGLKDPLSGLRIVRWRIMKDWEPKSNGFDIEAELNYWVERKRYKIVEIPIRYRARKGEKKLKLWHGFGILKRILVESMS